MQSWTIHQGEALAILREMPDASVDAVISDPPYSSGGATRGDRIRKPSKKYVQSSTKTTRPEFHGDARDQRAFLMWCSLWLSECLRVSKPGAPICVFSDWRQLPTVTDAIQSGGWVWRGVAPWDKGPGARPRVGAFRAQSEFVIWGSNGPLPARAEVGALPGVFRHVVKPRDKLHMTGKPLALMADVVRICPPEGVVLDPFAGSGTTLVAALNSGRSAIGIELSPEYSEIARRRCEAAEEHDGATLFGRRRSGDRALLNRAGEEAVGREQ